MNKADQLTQLLHRLENSREPLFQRTANDDEYEHLVSYLSDLAPAEIVRNAEYLLIFIGLFMRREVYHKARGLWPAVWDRLGQDGSAQTNALYGAMEAVLKKHAIPLIRKDNTRRFVETFWREVGITPAHVDDLLDLFFWYYDECYPEQPFSSLLFDCWPRADEFREQEPLLIDAVGKLVQIVEALHDPQCPLYADAADGTLRSYLSAKIGFDPYRVLPTNGAIERFYERCVRVVTPRKMRSLLRRYTTEQVILPDGRSIRAHDLATWESFDLGEYHVAGKSYQVSLHPKASVEAIVSWPLCRVWKPYRGYLAYVSPTEFLVSVGDRGEWPSLLWRNGKPWGWVWLGRHAVGRETVIDGHRVQPAEGVEWQPLLRLERLGRSKPPRLYIDIASIRVNLEEFSGQPIEVRCMGQSITGRLDGEGTGWLQDVVFELSGYEGNVRVELVVDERVLAVRNVCLKPAMLFSDETGVAVSQERSLGVGYRFYLFAPRRVDESLIHGATIVGEWTWGKYHVAKLQRSDRVLTIGAEKEWELFEQPWFRISLDGQSDLRSEYEENVFDSLADWSAVILTNVDAKKLFANIDLFCEEQLILSKAVTLEDEGTSQTTRAFRLERNSLPDFLEPGQYRLVVSAEGLVASTTFTLIPAIKTVHGVDLTYSEGEAVVLTVEWSDGTMHDLVGTAAVNRLGTKKQFRLAPKEVGGNLRLHEIGVTDFPFVLPVEYRPRVFAVRLLIHEHGGGVEKTQTVLSKPCRDDFNKPVWLYCCGRPGAAVTVHHGEKLLTRFLISDDGDACIRADFMKSELIRWRTRFLVRSEDLEIPLEVAYRPRVEQISTCRYGKLARYEVTGVAPMDVPLMLRLVDAYGELRHVALLRGTGKPTTWSGELGPIGADVLFAQVAYTNPDSGEIVTLAPSASIPMLSSVPGSGIGVSSYDVYLAVSGLRLR